MDLIEIVELRNIKLRINGFLEYNGERIVYYSTVYFFYIIVMIYLKWQNKYSKYIKIVNDILCQGYIKIFVFYLLEY